MAASKDILFWSPRGELRRNKRTILLTKIAELVEYVLLPHNNEVTKSLGLGGLEIDKGLIKNKKLLSKNLPRKIVIMRRVHRI